MWKKNPSLRIIAFSIFILCLLSFILFFGVDRGHKPVVILNTSTPPRSYVPSSAVERASRPFKKILVTGGAGFVGSHLVDKLMWLGHEVVVVDNLFTGRLQNIQHWIDHPRFTFLEHNVIEPLFADVDQIYHLASPASPPAYQLDPVFTARTNTEGAYHMLQLAHRTNARVLLASTSEVYGDPLEHPQKESYWGNVNPIGPRSCYDESKRMAETLFFDFHRQQDVDIRVVRIFNTYGPRMDPQDGRVVSNFIVQSLKGRPLTVYGDGKQTRSFQFVSDLVDGLHALMEHPFTGSPVNIGNPDEFTILELAEKVTKMVGADLRVDARAAPINDPSRRNPNITQAKLMLNWHPVVPLAEGLKNTIPYFKCTIGNEEGCEQLFSVFVEPQSDLNGEGEP